MLTEKTEKRTVTETPKPKQRRPFGTSVPALCVELSRQVLAVCGDDANTGLAIAAMVRGIDARNELEGLLLTQMITSHSLSMKMAAKAVEAMNPKHAGGAPRPAEPGDIQALNSYTRQAERLMGTFTRQLDALQKLRGKGPQRMVVEHVDIHEGGRGIIGNVDRPGAE